MTIASVADEKLAGANHLAGSAAVFGMRKYSAVQLLIALIVMLILAPFLQSAHDGDLVETALMTGVLLSAVVATESRRRIRLIACFLVVPALLTRWIAHFSQSASIKLWIAVSSIAFVGFIVVNLLQFVMRARVIDSDVLCAASAVYLMMGLLWAFAYVLTAAVNPDAFRFPTSASAHTLAPFDAMYFSYTSLSTLGCSDIVPASNVTRLLAMTEAMAGIFFMTVLIARLVTLYSSSGARGK